MSIEIKKVLANVAQSLTETEKAQARTNINVPSVSNLEDVRSSVRSLAISVGNLENYKQNKLTAGENITITEDNVISAKGGKLFMTSSNIASPRDRPYELFKIDGLTFTALASSTAVSLRVSSDTSTTLYGYYAIRTNAINVQDNAWTVIKNVTVSSSPYIIKTFQPYEIASNVNESLDINLFFNDKAIKLNILKYDQMYLKIIADVIES